MIIFTYSGIIVQHFHISGNVQIIKCTIYIISKNIFSTAAGKAISSGLNILRFSARCFQLDKDIQDIQDIPKSTQYQELGCLFTSPNTF